MFNLTYESLSRTCLNCHQTFKSELGLSAHQSVQVKRGCFRAGLDRKRQKHTFKLEAHKRLYYQTLWSALKHPGARTLTCPAEYMTFL